MSANSKIDGGYYRWFLLWLVMIGTFMSILDTSIVNVALPHMMSAFGVNRDQIEWVATGFMLATAVAMPLVGFLMNHLGSKVLYLGSLTMFTLGSAFCALAWSYDSLILARVVQAVGGGAIQPVGMAIAAQLFEPHERGKALGIWGTGIMIGPAVGLFGGLFLLPIFLENLVGYTTIQTGLWMMPSAIVVGFMMPVAGRMADKYSPAWLVTAGTALTGCSLRMFGWLDPRSSWVVIIGPQIFRGIGLAFMMAPLMTPAFNSVPQAQVATASSFFNLAQRVGGSFGIAVLNTVATDSTHRHAVRMGELIATESSHFQHLALKTAALVPRDVHGVLLGTDTKAALVASEAVLHKATVLGFDNGFVVAGLVILLGVPL